MSIRIVAHPYRVEGGKPVLPLTVTRSETARPLTLTVNELYCAEGGSGPMKRVDRGCLEMSEITSMAGLLKIEVSLPLRRVPSQGLFGVRFSTSSSSEIQLEVANGRYGYPQAVGGVFLYSLDYKRDPSIAVPVVDVDSGEIRSRVEKSVQRDVNTIRVHGEAYYPSSHGGVDLLIGVLTPRLLSDDLELVVEALPCLADGTVLSKKHKFAELERVTLKAGCYRDHFNIPVRRFPSSKFLSVRFSTASPLPDRHLEVVYESSFDDRAPAVRDDALIYTLDHTVDGRLRPVVDVDSGEIMQKSATPPTEVGGVAPRSLRDAVQGARRRLDEQTLPRCLDALEQRLIQALDGIQVGSAIKVPLDLPEGTPATVLRPFLTAIGEGGFVVDITVDTTADATVRPSDHILIVARK